MGNRPRFTNPPKRGRFENGPGEHAPAHVSGYLCRSRPEMNVTFPCERYRMWWIVRLTIQIKVSSLHEHESAKL